MLAHHSVHMLRLQLKAQGVDDNQETQRQTMAAQRRATATPQRRDGRAVHVRKGTRPEPQYHQRNEILGLAPNPGGSHRVAI